MFQLEKDNCINCKHFAWWEGDYCCTEKMKILQESVDGNFDSSILMSLKINKDCNKYEKDENPIYEEPFNDFLRKY